MSSINTPVKFNVRPLGVEVACQWDPEIDPRSITVEVLGLRLKFDDRPHADFNVRISPDGSICGGPTAGYFDPSVHESLGVLVEKRLFEGYAVEGGDRTPDKELWCLKDEVCLEVLRTLTEAAPEALSVEPRRPRISAIEELEAYAEAEGGHLLVPSTGKPRRCDECGSLITDGTCTHCHGS